MGLPDRSIEVRRHAHPKSRGVAKHLGTGAAGAFLEEHELPTRVPGARGISLRIGPCTRHWLDPSRFGAGRGLPAQMLPVSDSWPVSLADRFLSRNRSEIRWPVGTDTECGGCYSGKRHPALFADGSRTSTATAATFRLRDGPNPCRLYAWAVLLGTSVAGPLWHPELK